MVRLTSRCLLALLLSSGVGSTWAGEGAVAVLGNSVAYRLSTNDGDIVSAEHAELSNQPVGLVVHATTDDPQLALAAATVSAESDFAFRIQIAAPYATTIELFYQTRDNPSFMASRSARVALRKGDNVVLIELHGVPFNGVARVDPGEIAGDYVVRSIELFSTGAVAIAAPALSQDALQRGFASSEVQTLTLRNQQQLSSVRANHDAVIKMSAVGLLITATGDDPSVVLPSFTARGPSIIKIVLDVPHDTNTQVFYLLSSDAPYQDGWSESIPVKSGANTVYLWLPDGIMGALRLDPGSVRGEYVLHSVEVAAVPTNFRFDVK